MAGTVYRAGIVGCGEIGRTHASTFAAHERMDLVAVADIDESTREAVADEHDVAGVYADHEALFAGTDLDVVSICTWHATHAEIAIAAAEAGVDAIFCEKPMATSLGEAEDMVDAAERNDVLLTVEHNRRFRPENELARELIAEGAIDEPQLAVARTNDGVLNWGTHMIDHARYLLGDPATEWVMAQVERRTDRHERLEPIEDRCLTQVGFAGGARLNVECDLPDPTIDGEPNALAIYGTEGQLRTGSPVTVINEEGRTTHEADGERAGKLAHLDELVACLEGDRDLHRCGGGHARDTVEIMMAGYESVRTRGLVETPLRTRANPLEEMIESGMLPVEEPGAYDIRLPYSSVR